MMFDAAKVFQDLRTCAPVCLGALPCEAGIYALHDHAGAIRYIGITITSGFYDRINNRHVGGSESRSHKFSHAYNTGRMWRDKKDSCPDALAAKSLRRAFARKYCRATFIAVPKACYGALRKLEADVHAIAAPAGMLDWGDRRSFVSLPEPIKLVDALLNELHYLPDQRSAVARQAALHAKL
jgi:hypothetical protein